MAAYDCRPYLPKKSRLFAMKHKTKKKLGWFGVSFTHSNPSQFSPKVFNPFGVNVSPILSELESIYRFHTETRDGLNKHPGFF